MPAIVSVDLIEIAISEGFSPLGTAPNCLCMHTHVRLRGWIVGNPYLGITSGSPVIRCQSARAIDCVMLEIIRSISEV